jgi:hypothetical protein
MWRQFYQPDTQDDTICAEGLLLAQDCVAWCGLPGCVWRDSECVRCVAGILPAGVPFDHNASDATAAASYCTETPHDPAAGSSNRSYTC